MRIHNQENTEKIVGAPEFWCLGTRTLVPFQVDNRFFVLISKMGFRNINLSFFPSVFMCSRHFLFLLEHCQHKWENAIKKTLQKMFLTDEFHFKLSQLKQYNTLPSPPAPREAAIRSSHHHKNCEMTSWLPSNFIARSPTAWNPDSKKKSYRF